MYSTALSLTLPDVANEQRASHLADAPLLSLYEAFAAVPDPRSKHGQRYDLPYLLTCLIGALLCNCNSKGSVGQWCHDQQPGLASAPWATRLLHPQRFSLSPSGAALGCAVRRLGPAVRG